MKNNLPFFAFLLPLIRLSGIAASALFLLSCQTIGLLKPQEDSPPAAQSAARAQSEASAQMREKRPTRAKAIKKQAVRPPSQAPARTQAPLGIQSPERSIIARPARPAAVRKPWRHALPHAERTVSLRLDKTPMRTLSELLGSMVSANIALAEDIADTPLTMRAKELPWPALLDAIAQLHHFDIRRQGDLLLIRGRQDSSGKRSFAATSHLWSTELFRLSHTDPARQKPVIEALFARHQDKPLISVDRRTRSLIVSAPPPLLSAIAALLAKLDMPLRRVSIEAFIVEADRDFIRGFGSRIGINRLGDSRRVAGVVGGRPQAGGQVDLLDNAGLAVDLPAVNAVAGIGVLLDRKRLKLELSALEREGKSRIVSNPRILTMENQEALIFQGDEVPYFTVSDQGTQTQFKEAGIRLSVTPVIVGEQQFMLDVSVNKDTVDTRIENPPITRRHIQTRLLVNNRAVAVIGGIYFNSESESDARVPWLHRIPFLGSLFVRSHKSVGVRELLVFISPDMISANS